MVVVGEKQQNRQQHQQQKGDDTFFLEPGLKIGIPINLHTGSNTQKCHSVQMNLRNRFDAF